jgi:hypothetical protein
MDVIRIDEHRVGSAARRHRGSALRGRWRKAARSMNQGNCVEVDIRPHIVLVRDSKDRTGPVLAFTLAEWRAFLHGARAGEFNCPDEVPA